MKMFTAKLSSYFYIYIEKPKKTYILKIQIVSFLVRLVTIAVKDNKMKLKHGIQQKIRDILCDFNP